MTVLRAVVFIVSCCVSTLINARWLTPKEAPAITYRKCDIVVAPDGSSEQIVEITKQILNEDGRDNATIKIDYDIKFGSPTNIQAATYIGKHYYPVNKDAIEDKPLASEPSALRDKHQLLIAFPKAKVGAILKLKYHQKSPKFLFDNFSIVYTLRDDYYKDFQINIRSAIPLYVSANNLNNVWQIERKNHGKSIKIKLRRPVCNIPLQEDHEDEFSTAIFSYEQVPWISIGSLNNWEEHITNYRKFWQKIYIQKLPSIFQKIAKEAMQERTEEQQIALVMARLMQEIRYSADTRSLQSGLVPRDFAEIAKNAFGDCKDFSALTVAILTQLGFEAYPAIVSRGNKEPRWPNVVPSFYLGNHAIVWAKGKSGKVYWLDPTNIVSVAGEIFPDIADRQALVLKAGKDVLQKIPAINYQTAKQVLERRWEIVNEYTLREKGRLKLQNARALYFCSLLTKYSNSMLNDYFFNLITNDEPLTDKQRTINLPQLKSRLAQNLEIPYQITRQIPLWKTNNDPALLISLPAVVDNILKIKDDLAFGVLIATHPLTIKQVTEIPNIVVTSVDKLNYNIQSPWLKLKRSATFNKQTLRVVDEVIVLKNRLDNQEVHSVEFKKLQNELQTHIHELIQYRQVK